MPKTDIPLHINFAVYVATAAVGNRSPSALARISATELDQLKMLLQRTASAAGSVKTWMDDLTQLAPTAPTDVHDAPASKSSRLPRSGPHIHKESCRRSPALGRGRKSLSGLTGFDLAGGVLFPYDRGEQVGHCGGASWHMSASDSGTDGSSGREGRAVACGSDADARLRARSSCIRTDTFA
jgi:hypothetical protein